MAEPSVPGSYVGEHQNGYFWNGTSWDQGGTVPSSAVSPSTMSLNAPPTPNASAEDLFKRRAVEASSTVPAAPSSAFGGTIINQQNATPASVPSPAPQPAPAPVPSTSSSKRPSILATIMRVESGGKNVPQQIDDINMRNGDPAQGFYQITGGTWREFGGDKAGHKSALDAPYATQLQVAQNIPVARWGPATQQALKAAGYEAKPGETLGQMLARYNEDPTATRPEDVGGNSGGGTATAQSAPYAPPAGLLAQPSNSAALVAAQEAAAKAKAQDDLYGGLMKTGTGLLGQAETPGSQFIPAPAAHRPQVQAAGMPDFTQILAQQRLMRGT